MQSIFSSLAILASTFHEGICFVSFVWIELTILVVVELLQHPFPGDWTAWAIPLDAITEQHIELRLSALPTIDRVALGSPHCRVAEAMLDLETR